MEKLFYFFDSAMVFSQSDCFILDITYPEMTAFTGYNLSFSFHITDGGYIRKCFWFYSYQNLRAYRFHDFFISRRYIYMCVCINTQNVFVSLGNSLTVIFAAPLSARTM